MISFLSHIDAFTDVPILVIGDVILDRYIRGTVTRISPEAPVPILRWEKEWSTLGGAGNVAANLAALGCRVTLAGLVGKDPQSDQLRTLLNTTIHQFILHESPTGKTITKTRLLADEFHQLIRLDQEVEPHHWGNSSDQLLDQIIPTLNQYQAIVLVDYEKGMLTTSGIPRLVQQARQQQIPILIDPKKVDFSIYQGATLLKPNRLETERAFGIKITNETEALQIGKKLRNQLNLESILITLGPQGAVGVTPEGEFHTPAQIREVIDVSGAGDTVMSILAAGLATGLNIRESSQLAMIAAGYAVSKAGTYVVKAQELKALTGNQSLKILSWELAHLQIEHQKKLGKKIVFTNGCFDLLHAGHLYSLQQSRALGDFLVVAINSDASVQRLKGSNRPIIDQDQRAILLAGLACVDLVVIFTQDTPREIIRLLRPDILVKGGDHSLETIVGADIVQENGGKVVSIPRIPGLSTTEIVTKMNNATQS